MVRTSSKEGFLYRGTSSSYTLSMRCHDLPGRQAHRTTTGVDMQHPNKNSFPSGRERPGFHETKG